MINILCYYKTYLIQHTYFTLKDLPTSSWSTSLEILLTTTIWRGKDLNIIKRIKNKHDENVPVQNHLQCRVSLLTMQSFCTCLAEFPLLLWRESALSKQSICTYFAKFPLALISFSIYSTEFVYSMRWACMNATVNNITTISPLTVLVSQFGFFLHIAVVVQRYCTCHAKPLHLFKSIEIAMQNYCTCQ